MTVVGIDSITESKAQPSGVNCQDMLSKETPKKSGMIPLEYTVDSK